MKPHRLLLSLLLAAAYGLLAAASCLLATPGLAEDPLNNNHAERSIRPALIIRKNSYANQSEYGALTQVVLMSILRTLKQRGLAR